MWSFNQTSSLVLKIQGCTQNFNQHFPSPKRGIIHKICLTELWAMMVWHCLLTLDTCVKFQPNIFSSICDIWSCTQNFNILYLGKGGIIQENCLTELWTLMIWHCPLTLNTCVKFQSNIFSSICDIRSCAQNFKISFTPTWTPTPTPGWVEYLSLFFE